MRLGDIFQLKFGYFHCDFLLVDSWVIMLNILLSALIDPDRRLRSFRRSERLASILVCIILGACLTLLSAMYMHFSHAFFILFFFKILWWILVVKSVCPDVCFKHTSDISVSLATGFRVVHLSWSSSWCDLAFLEVILCLQPSRHFCYDWRYFSLVGLCLVGINPLDHLHCGQALLHTKRK